MALPVTGIWGDKYGDEYVTALRNQVPNLVVLGRDRPRLTTLEYWWVKLEWFAPWNRSYRPCLWIDLDTFVFDLEPFQQLDDTKFWMIDDFNSPKRGESGLMLIPKNVDHIWDALMNTHINYRSPDGAFLREFPHQRMNREIDGIYSYKRHGEQPDATVMCFHGSPKPHELQSGWAHEYWLRQLG